MQPTKRPPTIRPAGDKISHMFVRAVTDWYRRHGRALPWRGSRNPYRVLVSEIMLQQTQVSRVLIKYPQFLKRFPSLASLARAEQRDVVLSWRGMGYNNRAVRLHRLARTVVEMNGGRLPDSYESLILLPGIGNYTANALLSALFGKDVPAVDVNVRRFMSRVFWQMHSTREMRPEHEIEKVANRILPRGKAYDWNQALMDLGATICTARRPHCTLCPVARICRSQKSMERSTPHIARNEPSHDGIPNRVYRGRIIEHLRIHERKSGVRLDHLAKRIHPRFAPRHEAWLNNLIDGLRKDRLITVQGNGPLMKRRVSLA